MGVVEEFEITMDKNFWMTGETVEGKLKIKFGEPMEIGDISIKFTGEALVTWRRDENTYKKDEEKYLNKRLIVYGTGERDKVVVHPTGNYEYPFQFALPTDIPSSFHSVTGHVEYIVMAIIYRPKKDDIKCSKSVRVFSPLDLNTFPSCKLPWEGRNMTQLGSFCFSAGHISGQLKFDHRGYVPGEYIIVSGEVENASQKVMAKTTVTLNMRKVFLCRGKIIKNIDSLVEISKGSIQPGNTQVWYREMLKVPFVPPSGLQHCGIIDIDYFLEMKVYPRGPYKAMKVPGDKHIHNITIGTVALDLDPDGVTPDVTMNDPGRRNRITPSPRPSRNMIMPTPSPRPPRKNTSYM